LFDYVKGMDFPEMTAEAIDGKRFYTTPTGIKYPSVTTILGHAGDHSWLDDWKARVGEAEVQRVSAQASRRGTAVHELAEEYLKNNPTYKKGHMPANIASFLHIKPFLDKHLNNIYGLEIPLYSDMLRAAGRVDCIGQWDGENAIIDFKTSKRKKERDDIHSYFMQESAYAAMFFERTGILPKKLVTVMTVDDSEPIVFVENARDWIQKFIEMRNKVPF
jgi:genome maintenance exonuclease 1